MRTTLVIDDDLFRELKQAAARRGCTITSIVEDALRVALHAEDAEDDMVGLPVASENGGLRPGVDLYDSRRLRALLDEGRSSDALR